MKRSRALITALIATAATSGCTQTPAADSGNSSASKSTDSSTVLAEGPKISGDGYTFNAPKGWGSPQQDAPGFDFDSLAVHLGDADNFADNVNVIKSPAGVITPAQVETAGKAELDASGATDIKILERTRVAGEESAHVSAAFSVNAVKYTVEQYYVSDDEQTFIVTFSFSKDVPRAQRTKVADATLATWAWKN